MSERASAKVSRLLREGRVRVDRADRQRAEVLVRGSKGETYRVIVAERRAVCPCVSALPCSHAAAALLITVAGRRVEEIVAGAERLVPEAAVPAGAPAKEPR